LPALELDRITWRIDSVPIVDDVSLTVEPDEFVALIGPNGAGKTSLFNVVSGLRRPASGRIRLAGEEITTLPACRRARRGLGRTFQTSAVFGSLTVFENVALAVQAHAGGALRPWRRKTDRQVAARTEAVLQDVRLAERAATKAQELAHGEKRKLEIALVLAGEPKVLLLDEPMAGVSAEDVPALAEVIRALTAGTGRSVLMVEHHMDVVLDLADRVAVLHHGALLACDIPAVVMGDPFVQQAYLGEEL
jgi:branched-chain amino acid transport system ATP-binding protein